MTHTYTLCGVVRGDDIRPKTFSTRDAAEKQMFRIFDKDELHLEDEIKNSKHSRTYRCVEGRTWFHINRID